MGMALFSSTRIFYEDSFYFYKPLLTFLTVHYKSHKLAQMVFHSQKSVTDNSHLDKMIGILHLWLIKLASTIIIMRLSTQDSVTTEYKTHWESTFGMSSLKKRKVPQLQPLRKKKNHKDSCSILSTSAEPEMIHTTSCQVQCYKNIILSKSLLLEI